MLNENELIFAYQTKKTSGITEDENCFYVPLRITGTGETLRFDEGFYLEDRVKSEFLTKEHLDKCGRLPITLNHPKDNQLLNGESIKDVDIVGQTIASWVEGDEVWGLGRIYDKSLIERLGKDLKSTSPGVFSKITNVVNGVAQETPIEINHLALVEKGHWDMVSNEAIRLDNSKKEEQMVAEKVTSELEKAAEVKNDASCGEEAKNDAAKVETDESKEVEAKAEETKNDAADEPKDEKDEPKDEPKKDDEPKDEEVKNDSEGDSTPANRAADTTNNWRENTIKGIEGVRKHTNDEFVMDKFLTDADSERETIIKTLREICDSADTRLSIKMPYINGRETPRSVLKKFVELNPTIVSKKYAELMANRVDSIPSGFVSDILDELKATAARNESKLPRANANGWMDSGKGYSVRKDW